MLIEPTELVIEVKPIVIDGERLTIENVAAVAYENIPVSLSEEARKRVVTCRQMVEEYVSSGKVVYGVTTGFGKFSDVHISSDNAAQLQINLIRSHACAVGTPLPESTVRALML